MGGGADLSWEPKARAALLRERKGRRTFLTEWEEWSEWSEWGGGASFPQGGNIRPPCLTEMEGDVSHRVHREHRGEKGERWEAAHRSRRAGTSGRVARWERGRALTFRRCSTGSYRPVETNVSETPS
jgi:hypothetical protein